MENMETIQNPSPAQPPQAGRVNWAVLGFVVAGGLLLGLTAALWQVRHASPLQPLTRKGPEAILEEQDALSEALGIYGTSTELDAIEADLSATDLTGLDAELEMMAGQLE